MVAFTLLAHGNPHILVEMPYDVALPMNVKISKLMTPGSGILIQGLFWLVFWIGPAFHFYEADPRWAHNFAMALVFVTVGLTYHFRKLSCQLIGVFSSFLTIPTFLGFWSGIQATFAACSLLAIAVLMYLIDRRRDVELLNPRPRLKAWLKIHFLNFAYLGLVHMPLIFFLVRWPNPQPFLNYLPVESRIVDLSTIAFNLMLLVLTPLAIMERYVTKVGKTDVPKLGFVWAMLMIVVPTIIIAIQ